ncbi:hypothetical protein GGX14DRAFT_542206 [Mycena pura]|uniref:Uncharacterized protein n=1 Tax=Mycena pura TaxID=153505 RepID=A0AAD6YFR3_9AGAR|nr:hypothetical protein GGX14DRAFT_542206 [Mycena pura]
MRATAEIDRNVRGSCAGLAGHGSPAGPPKNPYPRARVRVFAGTGTGPSAGTRGRPVPITTSTLLKRPRSPSADEHDRPAKLSRLSGELAEPAHEPPPNYFEHGGVTITNLHLVSIDARGNGIRLTKAQPYTGLPTPDLTPPAMEVKEDPMARSVVLAAGHDSPANFAYVGDMKLFGVTPAQVYLYKYVGGALHPYSEVVKIVAADELSLGKFMPALAGSDWDAIKLIDPRLCFVESSSIGFQEQGLFFETDVVFAGALQPVSDFLRDFFHQHEPGIRVSARLGTERQYDGMTMPSSLLLSGTLKDISINVLDLLEFKEIGVELLATQQFSTITRRTEWGFGFGFFGRIHLSVPGTVMPLKAEYRLRKMMSVWELRVCLTRAEWNDVFGIKGVSLSSVVMTARLNGTNPNESKLSLGVTASIQLRQKIPVTAYPSTCPVHLNVVAAVCNSHQKGPGQRALMAAGGKVAVPMVASGKHLATSPKGVRAGQAVGITQHYVARAAPRAAHECDIDSGVTSVAAGRSFRPPVLALAVDVLLKSGAVFKFTEKIQTPELQCPGTRTVHRAYESAALPVVAPPMYCKQIVPKNWDVMQPY